MTVLRLPDEVHCDQRRVRGVVRDDGYFRRPCEHVDADLAEQHPFRFRDELVARPDDDVRRLAGEKPIGERRDRLHAAQREYHIRAGDLHRVEHMRMHALAAIRRRARHHEGNPCRLGRGDRHVRRSDVRVASGRHVAPGDVDGNQTLACGQARLYFERKFADRLALGTREAAHAFGGKLDIALHIARNRLHSPLDVFVRQDDRARPAIELGRVVANRALAVAFDLRKHLLGDLACGPGLGLGRLRCPFQILHGHG